MSRHTVTPAGDHHSRCGPVKHANTSIIARRSSRAHFKQFLLDGRFHLGQENSPEQDRAMKHIPLFTLTVLLLVLLAVLTAQPDCQQMNRSMVFPLLLPG